MKFWQKAYILTLTLFLVTMCASIAVLGVVSQNQSYEAECGKILAQQHALAQNFVTDVAAVNARRPAAVSQLAQNYAAQPKDVFLKVEQGENVWIDTLPIPDTELPEPPEEGKRVHTVRVSDENHFLYVTVRLPGPPEKMVTKSIKQRLNIFPAATNQQAIRMQREAMAFTRWMILLLQNFRKLFLNRFELRLTKVLWRLGPA